MLEGLEGEKRQQDWDKVREDNSIDFLGKTMAINYGLYTFLVFLAYSSFSYCLLMYRMGPEEVVSMLTRACIDSSKARCTSDKKVQLDLKGYKEIFVEVYKEELCP